ncbi:MAG: hypothetical protein FWF80_08590 [Defluviitaleaceae bacterium]|nr:hypothetical protein [Defluviitaleaceae bacterium]
MKNPIKNLSSGGIIANYKCPAACGHCLYGCSPDSDAGYIDEGTAANICKHLRRLGCRSLHIGGGEPFLSTDGLITLAKTIIKSGLHLDYIETNAAWITDDDDRNRQILTAVVNAGGEHIMVSADPFHVEFIPFWKPQKLVNLLRSMGIPHFIWQDRYFPLLEKLDPQKKYNPKELQDALGYDVIKKCAQEYGMKFNGRAFNLLRKFGSKKPVEDLLAPCPELRDTSHFHADLFGRYVPPGCIGVGIRIEDVGAELDPSQYPALPKLFEGGTSALLEYAQNLGYETEPTGYFSKCELCFSIRKYLITHHEQMHPDLHPKSFYLQDY